MGFHTVEFVENNDRSTKGTPVEEVMMEMDERSRQTLISRVIS